MLDKTKNASLDKEEKDPYEDYEPDHEELMAHNEALVEWKKNNPDWTDEDAADYYAQLQIDIARGK